MNILFLCHRIPYPPNKGDKIRSFNVLRYLSERHEVYLACLADDKRDLKYKSNLAEFCKQAEVAFINKFWANFKMLWCLVRGRPLTLGYFYSKRLKNTIDNWLGQIDFDRIYVFSSGVAQYVLDNPKAERIRKIMDFVDVDSDKWLQNSKLSRLPASLIYRIEGLRMRRYEIEIADDFQHSIFITENEKQLFQSFAQNKEVSAIANGVDLKYYCPDKNVNTNHGTDIVFTGAMDYFANVDAVTYFARDIFPLVKRQVPDAKFYIVGGNPAKAVRKLGRNGSIKITGFVNDARDYLRMASVCIVPLRIARGVQNKILEAMAMGRPVVATSKTAQNLDVHSGEDIFIEDEPERFGLRVVELLKDKELRERIGANARKTIEKKYNWQVNLHKLEQILLKEYDS